MCESRVQKSESACASQGLTFLESRCKMGTLPKEMFLRRGTLGELISGDVHIMERIQK